MTIFFAAMYAWGGVCFDLFTSVDTPLACGPLTTSESALYVSLICCGGLIGTIIAMSCADRFGRKMPLLCVSIPYIVRSFNILAILLYINRSEH